MGRELTREEELRIQQIDARVERLCRTNDSWIVARGESNQGIEDLINELMDERDNILLGKDNNLVEEVVAV